MDKYEVTLNFRKEPSLSRTVTASDKGEAIRKAGELARNEGWKTAPKSVRAELKV